MSLKLFEVEFENCVIRNKTGRSIKGTQGMGYREKKSVLAECKGDRWVIIKKEVNHEN
jgi:hypothetical protein